MISEFLGGVAAGAISISALWLLLVLWLVDRCELAEHDLWRLQRKHGVTVTSRQDEER